MNIPDLINGAFELTGGVVVWSNVRRLLRDRKVQGVDWRVSAFFSAWGGWNLFYYPSLAQWASFAGGVLLVVANTTWVVLALRFMKLQDRVNERAIAEQVARARLALEALPIISHRFKCECELCTDPRVDHS